ncbi:MAG: class II fructose-bisphosphate aldolase [bacterium]|nr:class II fructose-bisphosphate aldolase [bacterium]
MLAHTHDLLEKAHRGKYAVGAFNINNLEMLQGVVRGAEAAKAPVIVQTSEGAWDYAGMEELGALVQVVAKKSKVPIAFNFDHGHDIEKVKRAIESGLYSSVMVDASHLSLEENMAVTQDVVKLAHKYKVTVEAELGRISGTEDYIVVKDREVFFTDPEQAQLFVDNTKCDALAISVGTAHGAFKFEGEPQLAIDRIKAIAKVAKIPLVLHGASEVDHEMVKRLHKKCSIYGDCARLAGSQGVPNAQIRKAIHAGIAKINVDTDLRIAFTAAVREKLMADHEVFDPRKILAPARDLMAEVVREKCELFGAKGKGK